MLETVRAAALLAILCVGPAHAREVATGATVDIGREPGPRYQGIYWVEARGDDDVEIVALPTPIAVGEELDVIDGGGFIARVRVSHVERAICGALTYGRARAQVTWPGLPRLVASGAVAIGPARGRPGASRVLPPSEERRGSTLVDIDGDGEPDLARRLSFECSAEKGRRLACLETWVRDLDGWRRLARAEIGPCT